VSMTLPQIIFEAVKLVLWSGLVFMTALVLWVGIQEMRQ